MHPETFAAEDHYTIDKFATRLDSNRARMYQTCW